MHAHHPTRRWLAAAALAIATTGAWAGPEQVPFKASVVTQEEINFFQPDFARCPGSGIVGKTSGRGHASHMGAVTLAASDCPVTLDGVNFQFSNGLLTLTGANGDTLTALYSGMLLLQPGSNPPLHVISGSFSVTGGTGRFAGARGGGHLQGSQDLATLKGRYEVSGLLSYGRRHGHGQD